VEIKTYIPQELDVLQKIMTFWISVKNPFRDTYCHHQLNLAVDLHYQT